MAGRANAAAPEIPLTLETHDSTSRTPVIFEAMGCANLPDALKKLREQSRREPDRWLRWSQSVRGPSREPALRAVLSGWYQVSPAEALRWAAVNAQDYFGTQEFLDAAVEQGDTAIAMRGVDYVSDPALRAGLVEEFFARLATHNLQRALQEADTADAAHRSDALRGVLRILVQESPDLAFQVIDTYVDNAMTRTGLLEATCDGWIAKIGLETARNYLFQRAGADYFDPVYALMAGKLAVDEPECLGTAIGKIHDVTLRDRTITAMLAKVASAHPDVASRLVVDLHGGLADARGEDALLEQLEKTLPRWAERDHAGAFSYVYSLSALSSGGRNTLLQCLAATAPAPGER